MRKELGVKEVTERLFAIEKELQLFDKIVAREPFWELVRSGLQRKLLGEVGGYNKRDRQGIKSVDHLARVVSHVAINSVLHNPLLAGKTDILFFGLYRRRLREDGFWHDVYWDALIGELERAGLRCRLVERPPFGSPSVKPCKTKQLSYFDFIEVCAVVARRLGFARVRFTRKEADLLCRLGERINREFGASLDVVEYVKKELEKEKSKFPLYRMLMRRVAPKLVMFVNMGGHRPLMKACRELGIPLIEVQQGALHRYHAESAYGRPGEAGGRKYLPDYFFTYGDFWRQFVGLPPERVFSVGWPYYEQESKRHRHVKRKKNQILFLSQPMVGKTMVQFALEFANMCQNAYHVVYKLHPDESADWKDRYPKLVDSSIEVVPEHGRPAYELFAESAAQVGVSTTALFEGLGFGLSTYLIDAPGVELMPALVEMGSARIVYSPEELRSLLLASEGRPRIYGNAFFMHNALENMRDAVLAILTKQRVSPA